MICAVTQCSDAGQSASRLHCLFGVTLQYAARKIGAFGFAFVFGVGSGLD
jgi:hypothetical protein